MGTYKAKCDICFEETDVPNYGDWDCQHCHQPYTYDECHQIRLTDAQWEALRNPSRWIPVTERLPEPDYMGNAVGVLACLPDGEVCIGFCDNDEYGVRWQCQSTKKPTHWMPLPAPPAGGK